MKKCPEQRSMEVIRTVRVCNNREACQADRCEIQYTEVLYGRRDAAIEQAEENLTRRYRREESIEMIYKIRKMREEKMTIPEIKGKIKG